jgi:NTP pyrophosphatase (non-canonical NTP hydrolase)
MDLNTYQALSQNTEKKYDTSKRLKHAGVGMVTEIGEFATQVKRISIYEKDIADIKEGKSLRDHMLEELGDLGFYLVIPFNALNLIAKMPESSWMALLMEQKGLDSDVNALSIDDREDMLLEVTFQMAIEASRYLQNFDVAHGMAIPCVVSLLGLLDDAARLLGTRSEEIFDANVEKLQGAKGRYGSNGFSNEAAEARADKGGADARSS